MTLNRLSIQLSKSIHKSQQLTNKKKPKHNSSKRCWNLIYNLSFVCIPLCLWQLMFVISQTAFPWWPVQSNNWHTHCVCYYFLLDYDLWLGHRHQRLWKDNEWYVFCCNGKEAWVNPERQFFWQYSYSLVVSIHDNQTYHQIQVI